MYPEVLRKEQTSEASRRCYFLQQVQACSVGDGFDFTHEKSPLTFKDVQRGRGSSKPINDVLDLVDQGFEYSKVVYSPASDFPGGFYFQFFQILTSRKMARPLDANSRARLPSPFSSY